MTQPYRYGKRKRIVPFAPRPRVILSEAKDLTQGSSDNKILRFAQDDTEAVADILRSAQDDTGVVPEILSEAKDDIDGAR